MRNDASLVKFITQRFSSQLGCEYTRLPLFFIPDELTVLFEQEHDLLFSIGDGEDCLHLPYPDVLLSFPSGIWRIFDRHLQTGMDRGATWVRARTVATALRQKSVHPFLDLTWLERIEPHWLFLETWEEKTTGGGFPVLPDFSVCPTDTRARDLTEAWHGYPNQYHLGGRANGLWCNLARCTLAADDRRRIPCTFSELIMSAACRYTTLALAYIDSHVSLRVQVRPAQSKPVKPHVAKEKPWMIDREHYVLIDPEQIRAYGHPAGGSHASPIAHPRRGHWRRLPEGYSKSRTRVKATFVGEREWVSAGQRYRIVL